jgi:hypothetical protein
MDEEITQEVRMQKANPVIVFCLGVFYLKFHFITSSFISAPLSNFTYTIA